MFDKSRLLYGLDQAKRSIRSEDQVVIVEGYLDVIAFPYQQMPGTSMDDLPPSRDYAGHFRVGGVKLVLDGFRGGAGSDVDQNHRPGRSAMVRPGPGSLLRDAQIQLEHEIAISSRLCSRLLYPIPQHFI